MLLQQGVIDVSVAMAARPGGCALSHLRAIHGVVARNRPLLILEDDASLRLIGTISSTVNNRAPQWDLLLLGWNLTLFAVGMGSGDLSPACFSHAFPHSHLGICPGSRGSASMVSHA